MIFDPRNALATDPSLQAKFPDDYAWGLSLTGDAYYAWVQPLASEVRLNPEPKRINLGNGVTLEVYKGPIRQEMLYRIVFSEGFPERLMHKPDPYCLFWSYGSDGGSSARIESFFKDKFLAVISWSDKNSYVATLRQQHYEKDDNTFWSRQQR